MSDRYLQCVCKHSAKLQSSAFKTVKGVDYTLQKLFFLSSNSHLINWIFTIDYTTWQNG
jgi:hypothetical protein